jgi:hypothetical protein
VKKRVEIEIDRLVLHGIPAAGRRAVLEAVERELSQQALRGGIPADREVRIPEIRLPGRAKP